MDRKKELCRSSCMASLRQQIFVVVYTLLLVGALTGLWFRPASGDWPAWVQAIGSVLAILAALWIAQGQAARERQKESELRTRRERAARAVTPLALTQICSWAAEVMGSWLEAARRLQADPYEAAIGEEMGEPGVPDPAGVSFRKAPEGAVRDVQAMIEACDEEHAAPYVALLQVIQVQQARALGYSAQITDPRAAMTVEYCYGQVVETAEVYARASDLFDHARDKKAEDDNPVDRGQIGTALNLAKAYETLHPDLVRVADRKYGVRAQFHEAGRAVG
jgi:hypothetical protein